jgi:hypothetical protein
MGIMEHREKKTFNHFVRGLHRDVGYFAIGLIIIFSLSGILLVYRDTGLLKRNTQVEKKLAPGMEVSELAQALRMRELRVSDTRGEIVYFQNGSYNRSTGVAVYTTRQTIEPLGKLIDLHKAASSSPVHYFNALLGIALIFLALSSFWMFRRGSRFFKRGIYLAGAGILVTLVLLFI